jgi:DNA-binding SARP family transcriptional activator
VRVRIRLLGVPAIERDGRPARAPRGRKAWALLAYLLLAEYPPSRTHLAELLFSDANDPLGALRWTLAELRRALGPEITFDGDPVTTVRGPDVTVDTDVLETAAPGLEPLLELRGELLDGVEPSACAEFSSWLLVARHRLSGAVEARLREAAIALLAAGRAGEAIAYASNAVARNPYEEGNHELLVRSLAMTGDRTGALRQVAACEEILRRDLGVAPSAALHEAATVGPDSAMLSPLSGRAAAAGQLEAGRAAILAGAVDAGLQCLRRAVTEAQRCHDTQLQGQALAALGSALIHAVRGRDNEGAIVLHQAIDSADRAGDRSTAVTAYRELAFAEIQAGRQDTAAAWLVRAEAIAETDEEHAAVAGVRGMNASDAADYPAALAHFDTSVERATRCADHRQVAWSLALVGRIHVLRGEPGPAAAALTRALELVGEQRWLAYRPFPQALRAEVDLQLGALDDAADGFERAWVLACQVEDPCWEGIAARGIGLLHRRRGDHPAARAWLAEASVRCNRLPDRYQWMNGYVLDAAITVALDRGDTDLARPLATTLSSLAGRGGLRELVVRAHLHRYRLGDSSALATARLLGARIDNPALDQLIATTR